MNKLFSYAKINIGLEVKSVSENGFHPLQSIFVLTSLCDEIKVKVLKKGNIDVHIKGCDKINNTIYSAIDLYCKKFFITDGFLVKVKKRIPMGGGLGGGSSNAATILVFLNEYYKKSSEEELLEIAKQIGSDVPFFIKVLMNKKTSVAYVTGRGETVELISNREKKLYGLFIFNNLHCSTKELYKEIDSTKSYVNEFTNKDIFINNFFESIQKWNYFNSFTKVLKNKFDFYENIFTFLKNNNVDYFEISGSGSTLFALFDNKKTRNLLKKRLKKSSFKKKFFLHFFEF